MDLWDIIQNDKWKEDIVLASTPLWKYNNNNVPIANASGCIVDYAGCRFLLSIAHASIAVSEWTFEVCSAHKDHNGDWGTIIQPFKMNFLTEFKMLPETNSFTEPQIVDFTYRRLPKDISSYHVLHIINDKPLGAERTIFKPDFDIKPTKGKKYGFYGNVKFSGVDGKRIVFEHRLEDHLTYVGEENEHYIFKLPHKYGSHDNYRGCSGAPIIDEDNNLIALVSFGERSTNSIYGININKYKASLEVESKPL